MPNKTEWPLVELLFVVDAPLAKGDVERRRKLRLKEFMEGGHKKKGAKDGEDTTKGGGAMDVTMLLLQPMQGIEND
jgi:hypothetical protein